jgi:hypothetical protein
MAYFKVIDQINAGSGFLLVKGKMIPANNLVPQVGDIIEIDPKTLILPGNGSAYTPEGYPFRIATDDNGDGLITIRPDALREIVDQTPNSQAEKTEIKIIWPIVFIIGVILLTLFKKK